MRYISIMGLACLALGPQWAMAGEARTPTAGVYDNIWISPETGDAGGMAVDFRPGPSPTIVVTQCEGGCYGGKAWPVTIDGNRITFTVCDVFFYRDGRPAPCDPVAYTGVFETRTRLVVTSAAWPDSRQVLNYFPKATPNYVEQMGCGKDEC